MMKAIRMKTIQRNGLTVIEVLTAIIVALIGVAGVMVMIPFAVEQAKIGFDQETSYRLGANLANEFEIKGFTDKNRWTPSVLTHTARNYVIDPIGVAGAQGVAGENLFPFVDPALTAVLPLPVFHDQTIFIERVNILSNLFPNNPLDLELARHHMNWRDDLQVVEPTIPSPGYVSPDLAPPRQVFDKGGATDVRRQALGEMSVMAVTVPADVIQGDSANPANFDYPTNANTDGNDRVREYRNYFVVMKSRPRVNPPSATNQPFDPLYQVDHPYEASAAYDPTDPLLRNVRIARSGGTLRFREQPTPGRLATDIRASNSLSSKRREIRRGDWIALTNVMFNYRSKRFDQQINFYQVDDAIFVEVDPLVPPNYWLVTLRGPDFDFGWEYQSEPIGGNPLSNVAPSQEYYNRFIELRSTAGGTSADPAIPSRTYAIHLPDVWAVFEKTYRK
jgi:hypothetical protein